MGEARSHAGALQKASASMHVEQLAQHWHRAQIAITQQSWETQPARTAVLALTRDRPMPFKAVCSCPFCTALLRLS